MRMGVYTCVGVFNLYDLRNLKMPFVKICFC